MRDYVLGGGGEGGGGGGETGGGGGEGGCDGGGGGALSGDNTTFLHSYPALPLAVGTPVAHQTRRYIELSILHASRQFSWFGSKMKQYVWLTDDTNSELKPACKKGLLRYLLLGSESFEPRCTRQCTCCNVHRFHSPPRSSQSTSKCH